MNQMHDQLEKKIADRSARLAVIGLGYVGLPVAALFARQGFSVTGVDIKAERVDIINSGRSPIEGEEPGLTELLAEVTRSGSLTAAIDYSLLSNCDVVLIDVETPVNDQHIPEYQALKAALASLGAVLKDGALVVVESTIMPGTMRGIVKPALEAASAKRCGQGFILGNCPERVMPGRLLHNLTHMSRVVGGDSPRTSALMQQLYAHVVQAELDPADWITAELVKTVENAYRDVQIAFANEVALICEALGADVWRVRELVRKSPGREMLKPGAGVGGHCIPKDPWLLASSVRDKDVDVRLIPTARAVNTGMPRHMADLLAKQLGSLQGKCILILGYAYLEDSDDTRASPAQALAEILQQRGAQVRIHDPYLQAYSGDVLEMAHGCHAAALVTAHSHYRQLDLHALAQTLRTPLLVDGRGFLDVHAARQAGLTLLRLGDSSVME